MFLSKKHYALIIASIITIFLSSFGGAYLGTSLSENSISILNKELFVRKEKEKFPTFNAPEDLLDETVVKMESQMQMADKYRDNRAFKITSKTTILVSAELTANKGVHSVELYQKGKVSPIYKNKGKVVSIDETIELEPGTYEIVMNGKKLRYSIYDIKIKIVSSK